MTVIQTLQQRLSKLRVDAILLTSPEARCYATGFRSSAGEVIIRPDGAFLVVDFRYFEMAKKQQTEAFEVLLFRERPSPADRLLAGCKRVAVEDQELTLAQYDRLLQRMPEVQFVGMGDTLDSLRAVKSESEIARIAKAQQIAEQALAATLPLVRTGITERELAAELEYRMRKFGGEQLSFDTIALFGSNTALPHGVPGDRPLLPNQAVLLDFGCVYGGYCSDMTRTFFYGTPDAEFSKVYQIVLLAHRRSAARIRAGMLASDCHAIAFDLIEDAGYGACFGHGLGHSIGMRCHESPSFSPSCKEPIPAGAVLSIEPGIYLPDKFGVRVEDLVVIGEDGVRSLNTFSKELTALALQ